MVSLPVAAQTVPPEMMTMLTNMATQAKNDPSSLIALNQYGRFIQAVSGPFSLPGVVSASFQANRGELGDGDFSRIVLPLSHNFESLKFNGITPYSEVTFSYTDQKQNELWMEGMPIQMMVTHNIKTTSIMGGFGLDFEPVEALIIRPIIHLGWSRIKDNSDQAMTNNPMMTMMQQIFRNITGDGIFVWEVDQRQYGPAVEAEYSYVLGNDINVFTALRATQLNVDTISTSTSGLEESSEFHSLSGNLALDGPTSISYYGRDMRWQYFMGATQFDSATSDALKFNWIGEVGLGLSLVDNQQDLAFVEELGITASAIVGENDVSGWTVGIKAYF